MDAVATFFVEVWWGLQALPWDKILAYLAASGFVTVTAQFIKKKLSMTSKRKILSMVSGLTVVPSFVSYLASDQGQAWAAVLPKQFAVVFSGSILLHAFFVSPVWNKLGKALQPYWLAVQEIKQTQASEPKPTVLPVAVAFDPTVDSSPTTQG